MAVGEEEGGGEGHLRLSNPALRCDAVTVTVTDPFQQIDRGAIFTLGLAAVQQLCVYDEDPSCQRVQRLRVYDRDGSCQFCLR